MPGVHKLPKDSKLSVVIPAYNSEKWIGPTLIHLWDSLSKSEWKAIEILVIDDGSTDKTASEAKSVKIGTPVKVISRPNAGRLATRKIGIETAKGDYILMLDSRVYTEPGAFRYLVKQMSAHRDAVVWNGHIIVERAGNPFARFWYTATFLAWRRYMKSPELNHYGVKDFDYFPKGAGCFFAPRDYLLQAYSKFTTFYKDNRFANDDTSLIRHIASITDIYISPGFAFTYNSRSTIKAFIRHTLHRGVVLIDGYFRRGTRYFYPIIFYLLAVPIFLFVILPLQPLAVFCLLPLILIIFILAKVLGADIADAAALAYVMPLFAIFYTAGLYKGLFLRLRG
jgi:glycosyltransferase involved in cell wall biosynthesis